MTNRKVLMAEINTWVWLTDLERKYGRQMTLDRIPPNEWDEFVSLGFNAVWLMGIWRRSPAGRTVSRENTELYESYSQSLPDWKRADLHGSPYCIKEYSVDSRFGGILALEKVRKELRKRGMRLILDFVPNHLAIDHQWISTHPEYFIQGDADDLDRKPGEYFETEDGIFAYGRDPFFPPWQDVAQVNAFSAEYRAAAINELKKIGRICDGVRCDMAMLLLNKIFAKSWQSKAGSMPDTEFWEDVITSVKGVHPSMQFFAEVYWGLEWDLIQLGFDYCYDKRLYDRLINENATTIRLHLAGNYEFQKYLLRFLENHDEPRVASQISFPKQKAAALVAYSLPGASLLLEGQWEGRQHKTHVLLGRREPERLQKDLLDFYKALLPALKRIHDDGTWELCNVTGWLNNNTCDNLLPYTWQAGPNKDLIIVNYSAEQAQARVMLPWPELKDLEVKLTDNLEQKTIIRSGMELKTKGLFVDLPPWGYHFFTTYLR